MADIALIIDDEFKFGLELANGDLKADDGLETSVAISLFSDQRIGDDELPSGETSKRGYWGDLFPTVEGDKIGSKLWLLERAKRTNETLRKAEDYSRASLNWLIEDGVADSISVSAEYNDSMHLVMQIDIVKPKGRTSRFQVLWDKQELRRG